MAYFYNNLTVKNADIHQTFAWLELHATSLIYSLWEVEFRSLNTVKSESEPIQPSKEFAANSLASSHQKLATVL